jgi:hypothetical protein
MNKSAAWETGVREGLEKTAGALRSDWKKVLKEGGKRAAIGAAVGGASGAAGSVGALHAGRRIAGRDEKMNKQDRKARRTIAAWGGKAGAISGAIGGLMGESPKATAAWSAGIPAALITGGALAARRQKKKREKKS